MIIMRNTLLYSKFYLVILLLGYSCSFDNESTDIYSYQIQSQKEKLQYLNTYLTTDSTILDAEYYIRYHDNGSGLIPGPSDYYIKVALKMDSNSIHSFVNNLMHYNKQLPIDQWSDLNLNRKSWKLNTHPEYFISKSKKHIKILYRKENTILAIYSTSPLLFLN